jgi:hypothetical protein
MSGGEAAASKQVLHAFTLWENGSVNKNSDLMDFKDWRSFYYYFN